MARTLLAALLLLLLPLIRPAPAQADSPQAVLLPFSSDSKWGYVDGQDHEVIPEIYDRANPFQDGMALVMRGGRYELIGETGRVKALLPEDLTEVGDFHDGLAYYGLGKQYGFLDRTGALVIQAQFDNLKAFSGGLAAVRLGERWGFIDKKGAWRVPARFDDAGYFKEGLAPVEKDGKWGFIDKSGRTVIGFKFDGADAFSQGLAPAQSGDLWGFLNKKGKWAIPPKYDEADEFFEGLAVVEKDGLSSYIDATGKTVIPGPFEDAQDFSEGRAFVKLKAKGLMGCIDKTGKWVVPPQYSYARPFSNGWAYVVEDDQYNYIDTQGRAVWKAESFQLDAVSLIYLLGLLLPGLAARWLVWSKGRKILAMETEAARQAYYRLGLVLGRLSMAYIVWFFTGLTLLGGVRNFINLCWQIWDWERALGMPLSLLRSLYNASLYLLIALPLIAGMAFIRLAVFHLDQRLRGATWNRFEFLRYYLRGQVVVFLPTFLLMALWPFLPKQGWTSWFCIYLFVVLYYVFSPLLLRFVWGWKALSDPPTLELIGRLCAQAGLKIRGAKVLGMGSARITNAMVVGLLPSFRYILLTDQLLAHFTPEEVETVLAHELGHLKKRHVAWNMVFLLLWMFLSSFVYRWVNPYFEGMGVSMIFFYLFWLFLFFAVIFRFISRAFERQADDYGVGLTGKKEAYFSALNKLAELNFSTRKWTAVDRFFKTHPDIEARIQRLQNAGPGAG